MLDVNVSKPTKMTHQGVCVSFSNPLSTQFLTGVAMLMACISVSLNIIWQPVSGYFSVLIVISLGLVFYYCVVHVKKLNALAGKSKQLKITPSQIFIQNLTGQTMPVTIKSVWWHEWGYTFLVVSLCPKTSQRLNSTLTIWKSQNTAQSYRLASICLSNQVSAAHWDKAANSCLA